MATAFIDIVIGELDHEETYKRSGDFWENVYILEPAAPAGWASAFVEIWAGANCVPKRPAWIVDGKLATICTTAEVTGEHMEWVREAVIRTNSLYRERLEARV